MSRRRSGRTTCHHYRCDSEDHLGYAPPLPLRYPCGCLRLALCADAGANGQPALPARGRAQEQQETIRPNNRAAINAFAPSPVAAGVIWAGTNNGIIELTRDGGARAADANQHRGGFALRRGRGLRRHRPA